MPRSILAVYGLNGTPIEYAMWATLCSVARREIQDILERSLCSDAGVIEVHGPVLSWADRELATQAFAKVRWLKINFTDQTTHDVMWEAFKRPECAITGVFVDGDQTTPAALKLANPRLHAAHIYGGTRHGRWYF